jgi:triacylglycerol lipase
MTPIVLHHGLFGYDELRLGRVRVPYFVGIDDAIRTRGHPLIVSRVHPTGGIERRARELKELLLRQLKILDRENDRVVMLCHSMGGLDARYMISRLGMDDRVAALVTITTPHRGSPYADWCLKNLGERLGGLRLSKLLGLDIQALNDLTTKHCAEFNECVPDCANVRYFSVSAARPWNRVPPFAVHAHRVVAAAEGDNDSLVSVKSSTWGEHLGVWPADHWHTINHRMVLEIKEPTGDITPYYLKLLDRLTEEKLLDGRAKSLPAH